MRQQIDEEVSVVVYYAAKYKRTIPYLLHWQGRDYYLGEVDYYHTYPEGRDKQHVFELADKEQAIWFRLRLNSANLHWTLEAVHDGLPG